MGENRFRRDLTALLKEFKPQTMKWPDVVQRLRQLKTLIKQYSTLRNSEPDLTSKCLQLCLHKTWPHGLHSEALEVYSALLFPDPPPANMRFDSELAIYSDALFCFYDIASPENKGTLLRLFHNLVKTYRDSATLFMQGLVVNLLLGLDDPGNREATPEIHKLFDTLAQVHECTFHSALWIAVLRSSSEARVRALSYLSRRKETFIPNRKLVMNVLISCLEDAEIRVKRATLDFIVGKMNLLNTGQYMDEEKISMLVAVMRLLGKDKDPSLLRRVKEWLLPPDHLAYVYRLSDYCSQATSQLLKHFSESNEEVKECIIVIKALVTMLEQEREARELCKMVLERLTTVLILHVYTNRQSPVFESLLGLLSEFFSEESSIRTWEMLRGQLDSSIATSKAADTLNTIEFALSHVPLDQSKSAVLEPILVRLLVSFHELQGDTMKQALTISLVLLNKIEVPPKGTRFQRHLQGLAQLGKQDLLQPATEVCIALQEAGDWVQLVKDMCLSSSADLALSGAEGSCKICAQPSLTAYIDQEIVKLIFEILWRHIGSGYNERAVSLFANWQRLKHQEFSGMIVFKLNDYQLDQRANGIQQFAMLWASLRRFASEELSELFYSGDEVYYMLEGLESESPQIRHAVREWLLDSLPTFRIIIDPFLEPLASVPPKAINAKTQRYYYTAHYDTGRALMFLKKLRSLFLRGGEKLHLWLRDTRLSMRMVQKSPQDDESSYLQFLTKTAVSLVEGEADPQDTAFYYEDQAVRFSACEVIEAVLERKETQIALLITKQFLVVALSAIHDRNSLFQLQLLSLLRQLLVNSDASNDARRCKDLFSSSEFQKVLVTSIENQDAYLLSHWTDFVCQLYPLALKWMSASALGDCTKQLILTFANIVKQGDAKEVAFKGIMTIINCVITLPNESGTFALVEEFKLEKKGKESGWLSSLFGKSQTQAPATPFDELNNKLVFCFEDIFMGCYMCLSPKNLGFHASPLGLETSAQPVEGFVADKFSESIGGVLMPLFSKWPVEFFAASMTLWITKTTTDPVDKDSPLLVNLIRLYSYIGLSPNEILGPLSVFLRNRLANFRGIYETSLMQFLTTLLLSYPADAYQMTLEEQRLCISALLPILETLHEELSGKVEVTFWELELLVLISRLVPFGVIDKQTKSRLQELVKALMAKLCHLCSDKGPANPPFPPSIMQLGKPTLQMQEAAFRVLSVHLYPGLKLAYEHSPKELREQLREPVSILTNGLAKRDIPMRMLTSLLHALVKSEGEFITDVLRDTLTSTLRSDLFFKQLEGNVESLRQWAEIVEAMVRNGSRPRKQVLDEILADVPSGMFTSRDTILKGIVKALKTAAFLIYSGGVDLYREANRMIVDRVMNELTGDDVLPSVIILLRVLGLRLSQVEWVDMYELLRPHLIMRLSQVLHNPVSMLPVRTAVLKLLELQVSLGYEQFTATQWLFLYDSPNVEFRQREVEGFRPLVFVSLLPGYTGDFQPQDETNITVHSRSECCLRESPRTCFFTSQSYSDLDELSARGEPFINNMISGSAERLRANRDQLTEVLERDLLNCEEQ